MVPPRGDGGTLRAIVNGRGYAHIVKTQALRITVGLYDPDAAHVAIVKDTYIRGVMCDSELVTIRWGTSEDVRVMINNALTQILAEERTRLAVG